MPARKQKKNKKKLTDFIKECRISSLSNEKVEGTKPIQPDEPSDMKITESEYQQKKYLKIPPIFLHQPVDFKQHVHKLLLAGLKFYQPHNGRNYTKIKCVSFEDHRRLIQYLKINELPYHTYGNPDHRKVKVVIRGLAKDTCLNALKEDIESLKIPVVRLHKMHTKQTKKEHPLLVLVIIPNEGCEKLMQVETLMGQSVKMERPIAKPRQCHRCQKWGHSQRYCHGQVRCVKCAGKHLSSKCKKDPNEPPKCANCEGEHTASYRKCSHCPDSEMFKLTQKLKLRGVPIDTKPILVTLSNYQNDLYKNTNTFLPIGDEPSDCEFENFEEVD
ncbi:uncharacterized protein LOC133520421 [Cydia pomonella]|uniref:uncharacterized protein LOC133520421 n=1 Tax=Cydia pomonella TaxID=82600 RepID=UPI002ADDA953|nr:uncharacterized protein LOC133520421 [Cydia pomonella]